MLIAFAMIIRLSYGRKIFFLRWLMLPISSRNILYTRSAGVLSIYISCSILFDRSQARLGELNKVRNKFVVEKEWICPNLGCERVNYSKQRV